MSAVEERRGGAAPKEGRLAHNLVRLVYTEVMARVYSTYEAKAKLSEILRKVRAGQSIGISYRGDLDSDRLDVKRLASKRFDVLIDGTRPFNVWDGAAFHLRART